jgi:hypothetical protein
MNLRRHRKPYAALFLGMWLFALCVGMASACRHEAAPGHASMSGMAMQPESDDDCDRPVGCLQFCENDTPLLTKLQLVQDQPAGQPLLVATAAIVAMPFVAAPAARTHRARPPPDVPLILRTLRLAL